MGFGVFCISFLIFASVGISIYLYKKVNRQMFDDKKYKLFLQNLLCLRLKLWRKKKIICKLHYNILADHLEMQNNQIAEEDDVEEPYDKSDDYWRYIS